MSNFKDNWTKFRQSAFDYLQAVEGASSYPFDRIDELQRELATVKATQPLTCETCGCEQRRQP